MTSAQYPPYNFPLIQGHTEELKIAGANVEKKRTVFVKSLTKCPKGGEAKDRRPPLYTPMCIWLFPLLDTITKCIAFQGEGLLR